MLTNSPLEVLKAWLVRRCSAGGGPGRGGAPRQVDPAEGRLVGRGTGDGAEAPRLDPHTRAHTRTRNTRNSISPSSSPGWERRAAERRHHPKVYTLSSIPGRQGSAAQEGCLPPLPFQSTYFNYLIFKCVYYALYGSAPNLVR